MQSDISFITPMTDSEKHRLDEYLKIIRTSFITTVKTLAKIHSERLYRGNDGTRTWAQFCEDELNFSARLGYYFVRAFQVLEAIESNPEPLPLPTHEAQTRALLPAPPELIIPIWQQTITRYGDNPTAKQIGNIIDQLTPPVASALKTLAEKSAHGSEIVSEIITTGYLQIGDADEAIPIEEIRLADLTRYEQMLRNEAIARRIAQDGGVNCTIYPADSQRTARLLLKLLSASQATELAYALIKACDE
jgi:hypothetical protein